MRVAIRTDASTEIGTGHLMRCLTLAEELQNKGAAVVFVCRAHQGHMCDMIEAKGVAVLRLPRAENDGPGGIDESTPEADSPPHAAWLHMPQSDDAEQTVQVLRENGSWDWLIVDHYSLDQRWETVLRQVANKIMVIDDLADRVHDCDLLLDQNYFHQPEERYQALIPDQCPALLGPKYALLRPEFREARKFCRMRGGGIARVLVYFGGNDPDNLTGMALEALSSPELRHLVVDAVIGPNNPHAPQLETLAHKRPGTRLHIQPESFIELMLRADLCLGAGGTTTWERLCLGLPSLVVTVANNQEPLTAQLHADGYVAWIGRRGDISVADMHAALLETSDAQQGLLTSNDVPNLVDGLGALRVAEAMAPCRGDELHLRKACPEDMEHIYAWANDPAVRANAFAQQPIPWPDHVSWFQAKLASSTSEIFVLQAPSGLPVGQIRFDIQDKVANIDYSLDPLVRGRDWGQILLQMGLRALQRSHPGLASQAWVKRDNRPSKRCFQQLGFVEKTDGGGSVVRWLSCQISRAGSITISQDSFLIGCSRAMLFYGPTVQRN